MSTIITQFGRHAHPDPHRSPAAARRRQDRLAGATVEDMESALAFLSMIDPEAFEIAFTAAAPRVSGDAALPETRSLCRCAAHAVPRSGSSSNMACGGSTSAVRRARPAPRRSTIPAIAQRLAGSFPVRTRESSSQGASVHCPVGR
jgi:hypothetical protein